MYILYVSLYSRIWTACITNYSFQLLWIWPCWRQTIPDLYYELYWYYCCYYHNYYCCFNNHYYYYCCSHHLYCCLIIIIITSTIYNWRRNTAMPLQGPLKVHHKLQNHRMMTLYHKFIIKAISDDFSEGTLHLTCGFGTWRSMVEMHRMKPEESDKRWIPFSSTRCSARNQFGGLDCIDFLRIFMYFRPL